MEFRDHPGPLPEPPTIDEVARDFPVPLVTLVPQASVRATGVNTISSGANADALSLDAAALSYAVLRNPADLDDPVNHVALSPDIEAALADPSPLLPPAAIEWMRWMRFPSAYEGVQTRLRGRHDETLAEMLALQMRNVIGNAFREERDPTPWEWGTFVDPPSELDAVDATVMVDGRPQRGITIDDEHALGIAVELDDAIAIVVWPKHLLPLVRIELERWPLSR